MEEQRKRISDVLNQPNSTILLVEEDGVLCGYLGAYGGSHRRTQRNAYIVIGILQAYVGRGIGTALFQSLDVWALEKGMHRLELTVHTQNHHALMGFVIEGTIRDAIRIEGAYADEYMMSKLV